jgi:hypothetical protein
VRRRRSRRSNDWICARVSIRLLCGISLWLGVASAGNSRSVRDGAVYLPYWLCNLIVITGRFEADAAWIFVKHWSQVPLDSVLLPLSFSL